MTNEDLLTPNEAFNLFVSKWETYEIFYLVITIGILVGLNLFASKREQNKKLKIAIRAGTMLVGVAFIYFLYLKEKISADLVMAQTSIFSAAIVMVICFSVLNKFNSKLAKLFFYSLLSSIIFSSFYFFAYGNIPIGIALVSGAIIGVLVSDIVNSIKTWNDDENNNSNDNGEWKPTNVKW